MTILVTGASGRIGKYVILELEKEHQLTLFSRRHPRDGRHKFETSHPHLAGDLLDREAVKRAVEGADAVAHLGANAWFSPETYQTNTVGTYYMLEACREAGVKRFVMAGSDWGVAKSAERMSPPDYVPVDEAHPCHPHDHYGLSKILNEHTVEMFSREYGIRCAVLRITGVWMPEAVAKYAQADKRNAAAEGAPYWWNYVDVRDVARAFRLALEAPNLPAFGVYFTTAADTILEEPTMDAVRKHWPKVPVKHELSGRSSVLSWENAWRAFGYEPKHSWKNGG